MVPFVPDQKNDYVRFQGLLQELVAEGRVPQGRINDAVRRILGVKVRMGLFDRPHHDPGAIETVGSAGHREVARECVRQSLVLLKNEPKLLPLSARIPAASRPRWPGRRRPGVPSAVAGRSAGKGSRGSRFGAGRRSWTLSGRPSAQLRG